MWVSTVGRAGLQVTEEMEHIREVSCKHHEILSQGQNEMKGKGGGRGPRGGDTKTGQHVTRIDRKTSKYT